MLLREQPDLRLAGATWGWLAAALRSMDWLKPQAPEASPRRCWWWAPARTGSASPPQTKAFAARAAPCRLCRDRRGRARNPDGAQRHPRPILGGVRRLSWQKKTAPRREPERGVHFKTAILLGRSRSRRSCRLRARSSRSRRGCQLLSRSGLRDVRSRGRTAAAPPRWTEPPLLATSDGEGVGAAGNGVAWACWPAAASPAPAGAPAWSGWCPRSSGAGRIGRPAQKRRLAWLTNASGMHRSRLGRLGGRSRLWSRRRRRRRRAAGVRRRRVMLLSGAIAAAAAARPAQSWARRCPPPPAWCEMTRSRHRGPQPATPTISATATAPTILGVLLGSRSSGLTVWKCRKAARHCPAARVQGDGIIGGGRIEVIAQRHAFLLKERD